MAEVSIPWIKVYQAEGLLGEEKTPVGWNGSSQVQTGTGKECSSMWGLGRELHMLGFVGSPLPAYSCEHRRAHARARTYTHTPQAALDCVPRRSQNQGARWLDNVSMALLPAQQCALQCLQWAARLSSINGLLPPPWGHYLQPTGFSLQNFFLFLAACL